MPIAADYPLLEIFWTIIFVALWAVWIWAVIWSLIDNWRRDDHSGWMKAAWTVFIIIVPILGFIVYMIARPTRDIYGARPGDPDAYRPQNRGTWSRWG